MKRRLGFLLTLLVLVVSPPAFPQGDASSARPSAPDGPAPGLVLSHGIFGEVRIYMPKAIPSSVVLFASGDGGWNKGVIDMAELLVGRGAIVAGIDSRAYLAKLRKRSGCIDLAADFDDLGKSLEARLKLPSWLPPVLVGYSSGATLAYACLVQAPPGTFAGAISLGFQPQLEVAGDFCPGYGLGFKTWSSKNAKGVVFSVAKNLRSPWILLQGDEDQVVDPKATEAFAAATPGSTFVPLAGVGHGFSVRARWADAFIKAHAEILAAIPKPQAAADIKGLSLLELPASTRSAAESDYFVLFLSGDGGWANIDRSVAEHLQTQGLAVLGFDSLAYFWKAREPKAVAADLGAAIEHYAAVWGKPRVLLVGYSFGADVLPFVINLLPPETASRIRGLALLAPSRYASFHFQAAGWVGAGGNKNYPLVPEVRAIKGLDLLVVAGEDEADSPAKELGGPSAKVVILPGGHHFNNDFKTLARLIVEAWPPKSP